MTVNFPAAPANGTIHDTGNGISYEYDSGVGAWRLVATAGGANMYLSSNGIPTGVIPIGSMYVDDAGDGSQYIRTNDGTNDTWIQISAAGGGGGSSLEFTAPNTASGTALTFAHNFGSVSLAVDVYNECTVANNGYVVGDRIANAGGTRFAHNDGNTLEVRCSPSANASFANDIGNLAGFALVAAEWRQVYIVTKLD